MAHEELNGFRRDLQEPLLQGCPHCGTGNDAHHSYSCPTDKHPDRTGEFQPQYFSGLNWRKALKKGLVGEVVEFSYNGDYWTQPIVLTKIRNHKAAGPCTAISRFVDESDTWWYYCRTTPETFKHPTITIGGVELPRPEIDAPKMGAEYYLWYPIDVNSYSWVGDSVDHEWLKIGGIHLTESRAQEWADWWDETVVKAVNK